MKTIKNYKWINKDGIRKLVREEDLERHITDGWKIGMEDYIKEIEEYNKNPRLCPNCGKPIPFNKRFNKCCCRSCSAILTNSLRRQTPETRKKISEGVKRRLLSLVNRKNKESKNYKLISTCIKEGKILNPNNYIYKDRIINLDRLNRKCIVCGKSFIPEITSAGYISKRKTCSNECSTKNHSNISKMVIKRVKEDGRHQGWQSRKITSYPEKFWIKVLDNNNIKYIREYKIKENSRKYFLDFFITIHDIKLDLEIDGKQHIGRKEHDKERDDFLSSIGYIVYRIDWNNINSDIGKEKMKEKIDKFLLYYKSL